jgi:hypothetical protein
MPAHTIVEIQHLPFGCRFAIGDKTFTMCFAARGRVRAALAHDEQGYPHAFPLNQKVVLLVQ